MESKALKIGIALLLVFVAVGVAHAACDTSKVAFDLSQSQCCEGNQISAIISGFSDDCNHYSVELVDRDSGRILCKGHILDNSFFCDFTADTDLSSSPTTKTIDVSMKYPDGTNFPSSISHDYTIYKGKYTGICYDNYGNAIDCGRLCNPNNPELQWKNLSFVSLPLHISFGEKVTSPYTLSSSLSTACSLDNTNDYCDKDTFGFFTIGKHEAFVYNGCVCPDECNNNDITSTECLGRTGIDFSNPTFPFGGQSCGNQGWYWDDCKVIPAENDTHTLIRNHYNWKIKYNAITTMLDTSEYVPMRVGYNATKYQEASNAQSASQPALCHGSKTCYVGVPMCGDGICDTASGENCNSCPDDCSCANGCSDCYDSGFTDDKGCIIAYKNEGDRCICPGECDSSLSLVCKPSFGHSDTINLKYIEEDTTEEYCCPSGKEYNVHDGKCEEKKALELKAVDITLIPFGKNGYSSYAGDLSDMGLWDSYPAISCGAAKVTLTFNTYGSFTSNFDVSWNANRAYISPARMAKAANCDYNFEDSCDSITYNTDAMQGTPGGRAYIGTSTISASDDVGYNVTFFIEPVCWDWTYYSHVLHCGTSTWEKCYDAPLCKNYEDDGSDSFYFVNIRLIPQSSDDGVIFVHPLFHINTRNMAHTPSEVTLTYHGYFGENGYVGENLKLIQNVPGTPIETLCGGAGDTFGTDSFSSCSGTSPSTEFCKLEPPVKIESSENTP